MLPAPTAPSEGYAGQVVQVPGDLFQKSWLTSSGVASHLTTPSEEEREESQPEFKLKLVKALGKP